VRLGGGGVPAASHAFALRATLDHLPSAVLLIGADERVAWSNRAAERLLGRADALRVVGGRLHCSEAGDGIRLRAALAGVRAARLPTATLAVGRWGERPLHVRIDPLTRDPWAGDRAEGDGAEEYPAVALFLSEPDAALALDPATLAGLFGLTPAEAALAAAIGAGVTLTDHAATRGIAIGTARIQLKQVLAKTASGRQSELVRRLCQSLAERAR
jgi:DNA-binding CsgD family transcriptional regulator